MGAPETERAPQNLQGNHACALGAVAAGCRFYAGYPITPSSEVAERMAIELPRAGGVFIQMEDEIASLGAVLGASLGGVKGMTATSGPGFSLMQEHLGYAAGTEIPCVIVERDARRPGHRHAHTPLAERRHAGALGNSRGPPGDRVDPRVGEPRSGRRPCAPSTCRSASGCPSCCSTTR